jgi:hypothetical protein
VGVLYHGYLFPLVAVLSGVAQGSPLSPVLYLLAAQPLAARLRQLQDQGVVDGIRMPGGGLAPPCHQHADDTAVHTATLEGAQRALTEGVLVFGAASNARLNASKSHGMLLGPGAGLAGIHAGTGIEFVPPEGHVRHLGVLLSAGDSASAARVLFQRRRDGVCRRIAAWSRFKLSYLGRLHVAKQVLASSLYYHATFVDPPCRPAGRDCALHRSVCAAWPGCGQLWATPASAAPKRSCGVSPLQPRGPASG